MSRTEESGVEVSGMRSAFGAMARRPVAHGLSGVLLVLLGAFMLLPILLTVGAAFVHRGQPSVYWFTRVVGNELLLEQFANGLRLAVVSTALCFAMGLPLAVLRARYRFVGQGLLGVGVLMPLILPPFVGAVAIKDLLAQYGVLNEVLLRLGWISEGYDWLNESGYVGVAVLQALHLYPIIYLNASAALANIDPALPQAARNLGAGPVRTFLGVTLPLMRPGLFAGGTIVFIWSFTDIGTPLMLNYTQLVPVTIFRELESAEYTGRTFSLVFVMLAASVGLYVLGKFVFGRDIPSAGSKATVQASSRRLGVGGTAIAWAVFGGVIFVSVLPHIGVVLRAFSYRWSDTILPESYTLQHMTEVVTSESTYQSIYNSLQYAGCSTIADLILGGLAAWLIIRCRVVGRGMLDALVMLPLAVPGLILAAGYVSMTVKGSPLESIGPRQDPFMILVIAYAVRRLPFVVRGVSAGLEQVPESMEEAARNLGCSRTGTALRITVPLIAANLVAAGVLVFAFAMLEVSDSLILAQRRPDYPITKQIYKLFTSGTADSINTAAALGVYGMALLGGTMGLASLLLGRRLGAIFRA